MLLGKSVGILSSPVLEQLTLTPFEVLVQPQSLGHDDATPQVESQQLLLL